MARQKKEESKGMLCIAKNRDSFKKLYEGITKDVFIPALKNLPSEDEVKEKIRKGFVNDCRVCKPAECDVKDCPKIKRMVEDAVAEALDKHVDDYVHEERPCQDALSPED